MDQHIIIVAGGSGVRMGGQLPKQFLTVAGKPILIHTLERMHEAMPLATITLVLPQSDIGLWTSLAEKNKCTIEHCVVAGGNSRTESVRNGLNNLQDMTGVVGIHDGVRPCFDIEKVRHCFAQAAEKGNAIPAIPVVSTLRRIIGNGSKTVDREQLRTVQTPQCFNLSEIQKAYTTTDGIMTDDASVMEADGHDINLIKGDVDNIKITYPHDRDLAELILNRLSEKP